MHHYCLMHSLSALTLAGTLMYMMIFRRIYMVEKWRSWYGK
jgi:hypothetical protein